PIVEITAAILHLRDRPPGDSHGQGYSFRIPVPKEYQGIDCLRAALDIQGQSFVIVISWRTVGKEERVLPVLVAGSQVVVEFPVTGGVAVVLERIEHVRRVEVVYPAQVICFAVEPGMVS